VRLACTNSRKVRAKKGGADYVCSIKDINENCLSEFRTHWQCLENHNQQLWNCRSEERRLNKCVFEKLVRVRLFFVMYGCADLHRTWRRRYPIHPRARRRFICGHATSLRHTKLCTYTVRTAESKTAPPKRPLSINSALVCMHNVTQRAVCR
jgi:hypothetical protein